MTVEVASLAPGGDAVGRQIGGGHDGRAIFVPLGAPGDRLRARIVREKARVAWAELLSVERPGPDRVPPRCPLFGRCGGCQWQHVGGAGQLAAKRAIVERALGIGVEVEPASSAWGYRDRAKLVVGRRGAVGYRARRSHEVVDVPECPLVGPELAAVWPTVRAEARRLPAGSEIHLQAGSDGVAVGGAMEMGPETVDVGEPGLPALRVPAGAFAQVGRAANAALAAAVMEAVGPSPGRVVELYAGSGNFTRHLVARAAWVHASDGDPAAVARGRVSVPGAVWALVPPSPREPRDVVVLDPPRAGAGSRALLAAAAARRRIVYVSCDPQTLRRDARRLAEAGFELVRGVALDLMPHTFHVEVVATFDRPAAGAAAGPLRRGPFLSRIEV